MKKLILYALLIVPRVLFWALAIIGMALTFGFGSMAEWLDRLYRENAI